MRLRRPLPIHLFGLAPILIWALVPIALTQDPGCPAYPASARADAVRSLEIQRQFSFGPRAILRRVEVVTPTSKNFIDDWIFKKMVADKVAPAPLTTDQEFVRRIYLDLTGRIPT